MLTVDVYQNFSKTATISIEKPIDCFVIQKRDSFGNRVGAFGKFTTLAKAEKGIAEYVEDCGYRWIGKKELDG